MTDPRDPRTFPNRVEEKTGHEFLRRALAAVINRSPISLEVPITLVGFTALSEDVKITRSTALWSAASITFCVPRTFVRIASRGASHTG